MGAPAEAGWRFRGTRLRERTADSCIHFARRAAFDIAGIGEETAAALVESGLVRTPADLFRLRPADIALLPGFAGVAANKLVDAIRARRTIELDRFLVALAIPGVGPATARALAGRIPSLAALRRAAPERLASAAGVGATTAAEIAAFFADRRNARLLADLAAAGVRVKAAARASSPLQGVGFVFTGSLERMTREDAANHVRSLGGTVQQDVSRRTDWVVVGDEPGSKLERARSLGCATVDEKRFLRLLRQAGAEV